MNRTLTILSLTLLLCVASASGQIYRVAQMNAEQIRALDKQKTAVILTGGILEEHGPYLPSYSDGYMNEWFSERLAEQIAARPGWSVLMFPAIPLGQSGANDIGGQNVFPGTYSVRASTLRSVFMDLASELGEQGFRWIFVVHGHGSPMHNLMLDQAGDYFRDVYKGKMVNLFGLLAEPSEPPPAVTPEARKEDGTFEVHAGMSETSRILFLRPDLVPPIFRNAKPYTANDMSEAARGASGPDWPGYIGSPRLATASYGAQEMRHRAHEYGVLALAILDGLDERKIPRLSILGFKDPAVVKVLEGSANHWTEIERRQTEWMSKNGIK